MTGASERLDSALAAHLVKRLRRLAEAEAISLNQLVTVAGKIARLAAEAFARGAKDVPKRAPARIGQNSPPDQATRVRDA